jgi:hypothetical protein
LRMKKVGAELSCRMCAGMSLPDAMLFFDGCAQALHYELEPIKPCMANVSKVDSSRRSEPHCRNQRQKNSEEYMYFDERGDRAEGPANSPTTLGILIFLNDLFKNSVRIRLHVSLVVRFCVSLPSVHEPACAGPCHIPTEH